MTDQEFSKNVLDNIEHTVERDPVLFRTVHIFKCKVCSRMMKSESTAWDTCLHCEDVSREQDRAGD